MELIIPILLLLAVGGIFRHSHILHRKALDRQAMELQWYQTNIERKREVIQLQKEGNELLKQILAALKPDTKT